MFLAIYCTLYVIQSHFSLRCIFYFSLMNIFWSFNTCNIGIINMRLFFAKFNFQIGMTVFPIALFCYNELQYHEIDLCILIRQFFPLQVIGRHLCHNLQVLANSNLNNMYRYVNTQFLIFKVPHILNIFNRSPRINISLVLYIS